MKQRGLVKQDFFYYLGRFYQFTIRAGDGILFASIQNYQGIQIVERF
jgi:hypothetical protein